MNFDIPKALWNEYKGNLATYALILLTIYALAYILRPQTAIGYSFLIAGVIALNTLIKNDIATTAKNYTKNWFLVYIAYYAINYLGGYGIAGLILICILYAAYRIYMQWSMYIESMETIETMIFGKPIIDTDKEEEITNG